ncbi:hypothetical protein E2C01_069510 [Portunus trituberculatus]|uniref:Uncharacterized protein n=1 Tax=Portunus trituberculatus TaxID=210409 RepID=A0A5B7HZ19_PORTR|nr:hypothetical protein [Portunus trituberculatus]
MGRASLNDLHDASRSSLNKEPFPRTITNTPSTFTFPWLHGASSMKKMEYLRHNSQSPSLEAPLTAASTHHFHR